MNEMIERVARAIEAVANPGIDGDFSEANQLAMARAAIDAMREPTFAMSEAAEAARDRHSDFTAPETTYRAMIAAALNPEPVTI